MVPFHRRCLTAVCLPIAIAAAQAKPAGAAPSQPPAVAKPAPKGAALVSDPPHLLAVGAPAPTFAMVDVDGNPVDFGALRGKVVVLAFWATWCAPCKVSLRHAQEVAAKYADQDVVVIASCTDDEREAFRAWVLDQGSRHPAIRFAFDPKGKAADRAAVALYGVMTIPTQIVIGKDGKAAAVEIGYLDGEVLLDAALAKAGVKVAPEVLAQAERDLLRRAEAAAAAAKPKPAAAPAAAPPAQPPAKPAPGK